jgi:hypothetical protein
MLTIEQGGRSREGDEVAGHDQGVADVGVHVPHRLNNTGQHSCGIQRLRRL